MYLISPNKKQFKANLHSHTTRSDGHLTAEEMKKAYRERGYSILAITDHEAPKSYTELSEEDFLMLTGYEAYIRPNPNYQSNYFEQEIHLNLFARDPGNEAIVCFNERSTKYLSQEEKDALCKVGSQRTREYTVEYINEFIRTARENGYLVSYNHPVWSMEPEERILSYEGCFSLELVNGECWKINALEHNGTLYQKLLRSGKRMFVHGADDNHNKVPFDNPQCGSFVAATMIMADELEYSTVYNAMEQGEMYCTMGPTFKEVSFDGEKIHVECSDVVSIVCQFGSKKPASAHAAAGETICSADLAVQPGALYVQVSIMDKHGNRADTRGYFRDELGLPPLEKSSGGRS